MKELSESKEVQKAYLKIDLCYLNIEKARKAFGDKFEGMSDFDKKLAEASGAFKAEAEKFVGTWITNLEKIIKYKKQIEADWGKDQQVLEGLKKSLQV